MAKKVVGFIMRTLILNGHQFLLLKELFITASQFPLRLAMGKTVHKSQGDTLNEVVVDMSTYRPVFHSHYVAFSRVRNKSGLFIRDLAEDKIKIDGEVKIEMIRLRTTCQLKLCYTPAYNFPKESLKVSFLNSRSLHKHFEDVKNDQSFQCCDIIAFAETRLYDNEWSIIHWQDIACS